MNYQIPSGCCSLVDFLRSHKKYKGIMDLNQMPSIAKMLEGKEEEKRKRIAAALDRLAMWSVGLTMVPILPVMRESLEGMLGVLMVEIRVGSSKQFLKSTIAATKLALHEKKMETDRLTDEQKEFLGKEIDLVTDAIELSIDNSLFIDWSNLLENRRQTLSMQV